MLPLTRSANSSGPSVNWRSGSYAVVPDLWFSAFSLLPLWWIFFEFLRELTLQTALASFDPTLDELAVRLRLQHHFLLAVFKVNVVA